MKKEIESLLKRYHKAEENIELSHNTMVEIIKALLIQGLTFGEIGEYLGKSKQAIWSFYRYHLKK